MSSIIQYIGYVDDISKPRQTMNYPVNVSSVGEKTLTPDIGFTSFNTNPNTSREDILKNIQKQFSE